MGFRTVIITNQSKLTLRNEYMIIHQDTTKEIHLSEISILIIESNQVVITIPLINTLVEKGIMVLICDRNHNPSVQLIGLQNHHRRVKHLNYQIKWKEERKLKIWKEIVIHKIANQNGLLTYFGLNDEEELLRNYLKEVVDGDSTNREGLAAKIYFRCLFSEDFIREEEVPINWALNYGYQVLLSLVNRSIVSKGYLTELGIHHKSEYNNFNLSSDLMEPFRPVVDNYVKVVVDEYDFTNSQKISLLEFLNSKVMIDGKEQFLPNAISIYIDSIFNFLNGKVDTVIFPDPIFINEV